MHYPWWYVPVLTSPMLIAVVAVVHVLVSHYAVGGGLFLAVETQFAYRSGNRPYLDYLRKHAWFFILVTVVYAAGVIVRPERNFLRMGADSIIVLGVLALGMVGLATIAH